MRKYIILIFTILLITTITICRNDNNEIIIRKSIRKNLYGFTNYSVLEYSILNKVKSSGILEIGFSEEISPFIYSEDDIYKGYIIELLYEITKDLNIDLKVNKIKSEKLLNAIILKDIDIAVSDDYNTKQREYIIDYSIPYFIGGIRLLTRRDNNINSITELSGKTICVLESSNGNIENQLREQIGNIYIYKIDSLLEIDRLINNNVINAFAGNTMDILRIINQRENDNFYNILIENIHEIPYSFLLIENDSEWRDYINNNIQILFNNGTLKSLYNKYFNESAKYNVNFDWIIKSLYITNE